MRVSKAHIAFLFLGYLCNAQVCPIINSPANGDENVPIDTSISWGAIDDASGYFLLVGTTPGGRDIIDRIDVGNTITYTPTFGLPENTDIYVKVTVYFENTFDMTCPYRSFKTASATAIPDCTKLTNPLNGSIDAPATTILEWEAVSRAAGYKVGIGSLPSNNDIMNEMVFLTNTTEALNLPSNSTLHITINPFNTIGDAIVCTQESFKTILDCSHTINAVNDFYTCDLDSDHFEEFNIDLTDLESRLIGNQSGLAVTYHNAGGDLIDFSLGTQFALNQRTILARATNSEGCYKETSFKLIVVAPPIADILMDVEECESYILPFLGQNNQYFTKIGGKGNSLNEGEVIASTQTIYIYASLGNCTNESSFTITIDHTICEEPIVENNIIFPKFFTPNGDGINDYWQFSDSMENNNTNIETILIFDRYGSLLVRMDSNSKGWDGNFKGKPVPSSDYWFKVLSFDRQEINGHFALKR